MSDSLNVEGWSCPAPLRDYPTVVLGHGGGGRLMTDLIDHLFLEAFSPGGEARRTREDAAVLDWPGGANGRLARRLTAMSCTR